MKIFLLTVLSVGLLNLVSAQVGVNTVSPKSTLHVSEKRDNQSQVDPFVADGIIIPKLTKAELATKDMTTYTSEHEGTFVYITDATSTSTGVVSEIHTKGFYYLDNIGTELKWRTFANLYNKDGELAGHRNVNLNSNKLSFSGGSTTNAFSIDDSTISVDAQNHRVGFGTATPRSTVTVDGILTKKIQIMMMPVLNIQNQHFVITEPITADIIHLKTPYRDSSVDYVIIDDFPDGYEGQQVTIVLDKTLTGMTVGRNSPPNSHASFFVTSYSQYIMTFVDGIWRGGY
ncbi:hypothetical protein [Chryseobacterium sp.]|uniref:hypothetical protein n=1 Tax=Chryseobacterium sp. TaxID=1871047 RepID=UPI00388D955C